MQSNQFIIKACLGVVVLGAATLLSVQITQNQGIRVTWNSAEARAGHPHTPHSFAGAGRRASRGFNGYGHGYHGYHNGYHNGYYGNHYYHGNYYNGNYYGGSGWYGAPVAAGVVAGAIATLPSGCSYNGYYGVYNCSGVYYQRSNSGYVVVRRPY